ncbi:MAG TPA: hypothetical protein VKQ29_12125 [Aliidongia sp.]|nr:hypothetical protein [Aliidongia sp.]
MKLGLLWRRLPPIAALALLGTFCGLYSLDRAAYYEILEWVGIVPFRYPFLDSEYILAGVECWHRGIDVYANNPCDVLGRPHGYSPLWLRASFLPTSKAWTDAIGLPLAITFILSLFLLPEPRRRRDAVLLTLATVSTMTSFAVERGNVDLIMFLAAMLAALWHAGRLPVPRLGYLPVMAAGLLKFYPLVLLILSFSEKPRRWLAINAIAGTIVLIFGWWYWPELVKMAPNIPHAVYFGDLFGAANLPYGIGQLLVSPTSPSASVAAAARYLPRTLLLLLVIDSARRAIKLSTIGAFQVSLAGLSPWNATLLVIGSALICGCFFAGQSVGYRGVHLLFVAPTLLVLAQDAKDDAWRRRWRHAVFMIVFLMWGEGIRRIFAMATEGLGASETADMLARMLFWLFRELVWWRVVTLLGAVLLRFVRSSETGRAIARMTLSLSGRSSGGKLMPGAASPNNPSLPGS